MEDKDFHCAGCKQHYYLHKGQWFGPPCDWCTQHAEENSAVGDVLLAILAVAAGGAAL